MRFVPNNNSSTINSNSNNNNNSTNNNNDKNKNKNKNNLSKNNENNGGIESLSQRLSSFRKWLSDHGCIVHPSVCIVNGEATDGTKNAPVLIFENPSSHSTNNINNSMTNSNNNSSSNQILHPNHKSPPKHSFISG